MRLGVVVSPSGFRHVTATEAAWILERAPGTIHCWAIRYGARKVKVGKIVYYDFNDLSTIERAIKRGDTVPPTWQERAELMAGTAA